MATVTCAANICIHPGARHNSRVLHCYGGCERIFHLKCIGVNAAIANACKDISGLFWFCDDCQANSLFVLHRRMSFLCDTVKDMRLLIRQAETNLESKVVTCYNMIHNLAKVHSLTSAHGFIKQCCHAASEPALDLSTNIDDCDNLPGLTAPVIGKRGPTDESDGPSKRFRNLVHTATDATYQLADLPTPTYSCDPETESTSAAQNDATNHGAREPMIIAESDDECATTDMLISTQPVAATDIVSTGNCSHSICPAEAGRDAAPQIACSQISSAAQTSTVPTSADANQLDFSTMLFSESSLIDDAPVPGNRVILTGKRLISICPAEAGPDSAPLSENVLSQHTRSAAIASLTGTALPSREPVQQFVPVYTTAPTVNTRCTPAPLVIPVLRPPLSGNAANCICLAGADNDAAHFNGPSHSTATIPRTTSLPPAGFINTQMASSSLQSTLTNTAGHLPNTACSCLLSGNASHGICLAEANYDTAHLNNTPIFAANSTAPWFNNAETTALSRPPVTTAAQRYGINNKKLAPASGSLLRNRPSPSFRPNQVTRFNFTPNAPPSRYPVFLPPRATQTGVDPLAQVRPLLTPAGPPAYAQQQIQPVAVPILQPPLYNATPLAARQFYVRPFEPSTSAEQITEYIRSKTGWSNDYFSCVRLASTSRRNSRPLSFVSFKILVLDHPTCVNTISDKSFWPDFVSVEPFKPQQRR